MCGPMRKPAVDVMLLPKACATGTSSRHRPGASTPGSTGISFPVFARGLLWPDLSTFLPFLFPFALSLLPFESLPFERLELCIERDPARLFFGEHARQRGLTFRERRIAVLDLLELRPDSGEHVRLTRFARRLVELLQHLTEPRVASAFEAAYLLFGIRQLLRKSVDSLLFDLQPGDKQLRPETGFSHLMEVLTQRAHLDDHIIQRCRPRRRAGRRLTRKKGETKDGRRNQRVFDHD